MRRNDGMETKMVVIEGKKEEAQELDSTVVIAGTMTGIIQ